MLERFHRAQFFFPLLLKAAGHQPMLGLDRMILALGSFSLIASSLQPKLPLALQGFGLSL